MRPKVLPLALARGSNEKEIAEEVDLERFRSTLHAAAARIVPDWLVAHREDIVQASMMRILGVLKTDSRVHLSATYLWRVAYSVTIDEIRKARSRREEPLAEPDGPATSASPEGATASKEIGAAIRDCLGRLAEDRRRAVSLYLVGHGSAEIARLLGWNAKRAENLVGRGLADLRACLASKGHAP